MKKVLFLGDSITDALRGRGENEHHYIGAGYAMIAAGKLALEDPTGYEFTNLGISGNRVVDLYARIKCDCWNLEPDYCSILLGVNDVMHELERGNGVDAKRFEHIYRTMVEETMERLPNCKLMLMEPFCLRGWATDPYYDEFRKEVDMRGAIVRKIAEEKGLVFVPLQAELDQLAKRDGDLAWCKDGVHPTLAGHALMAKRWLEGFEKLNA